MNTFFTKLSENEYLIDGELEVRYESTKSVIVDGETYTKSDFELKKVNLFDFYNDDKKRNNFDKFTLDSLEFLGLPIIYVYDYGKFSKAPSKGLPFHYSENEYVNIICNFYKLYPDDIIKNLYCGKKSQYHNFNFDLYENSIISLEVYKYGFNNSITIDIEFKNFIQLDISKIDNLQIIWQIEHLCNCFRRLLPSDFMKKKLSDYQINQILIKFLNEKANYKDLKNKQQKRYETS